MKIKRKTKYWMSVFLMAILTINILFASFAFEPETKIYYPAPELSFWQVRSIDTMKYSRDLSREKLYDQNFDKVIDEQTKNIAEAGATHIAIDTPYDEEFLPILRRWVKAARKYELKSGFAETGRGGKNGLIILQSAKKSILRKPKILFWRIEIFLKTATFFQVARNAKIAVHGI